MCKDLLEGLTELRKAVILKVTVYYSKISKGKEHRGQVPGLTVPSMSFQVSSPSGVCGQCLLLPATMCDSTYRVLPATEVPLALGLFVCVQFH